DEAAARRLAGLHDVAAFAEASHRKEGLRNRIAPLYPPGIERRIVNPQRCAIGLHLLNSVAGPQRPARRNDPYILDSAAFEHPAEMPFPWPPAGGSVVEETGHIEVPGADEPAIKISIAAGAAGGGSARNEGLKEGARLFKLRGSHGRS